MEEIRSRYKMYAKLLGKRVHVTVNRPLGSLTHSQAGGAGRSHLRYPVNCGYITVGHEEEPLLPATPYPRYAYVLGVDTPLSEFTGRIIAVINRAVRSGSTRQGDDEASVMRYDRLVVAPEGVELYEPQIRDAVAFAERRGRYRLYCMYEKSCGAVVYTMHDGTPLYLLIRNRSGHIGFPKGHVEFGEDECATMKREIREETSLSVEPELAFREEYNYVLWNVVHKTAVYSLARFPYGNHVTTMENEIFGDWLLPLEEACNLLSYDNDRRILRQADHWIRAKLASP